jgi:hypothetical protein
MGQRFIASGLRSPLSDQFDELVRHQRDPHTKQRQPPLMGK